MSKCEMRVEWATHKAAKYAVENWHYSKRLPMPPMIYCGVWEDGLYVGVVIFGRGANYAIGKEYGLSMTTCCELVRIALTKHKTEVSRIVAVALKFLKKQSPGLRLVVSYADAQQGHHGGVYQAGGWFYVGKSMGSTEWWHEGRWKHNREVTSGAFGGQVRTDVTTLKSRKTLGKHKYLFPLDKEMTKICINLARPYPKRAGSIVVDVPAILAGEGGSIPTPALQDPKP